MRQPHNERVWRHLPRAARLGAVGAIVAVRLAIGPLVASDEPSPPATAATATPGSAGGAGKAVQVPQPSGPSVLPQPQVSAPSTSELMPHQVWPGQKTFVPTPVQMRHAKEIVRAGQKLNLPPRAYVIAVATSLQETKLHNYGHLGARNDHDSLGLFQQRPSTGWGDPQQLTDPDYAATAFYKALSRVPGWQDMPLTQAAQAVQVSAFPDRYAQWEVQAAQMVQAAYGTGPLAGVPSDG